ncbi:hypothetical protein [Amycolatopsis sp. GM8]|uniref:hypothetical protein n=1 Tax=Amycolatopsis sp. GM8 TaxID=2896530 RepID=UPI001F245EE1|nr:hypothetical protein [Amycolatopsis sp. GM8]
MRTTFENHLQHTATQAISAIPATETSDIYVVSLLVEDEDDDPSRPTVTIGYNTEARVQQMLAAQRGSTLLRAGPPADHAEARWNYAFWLQNQLAVSSQDAAGAHLRGEWIRSLEVESEEQVSQRFVDVCVRLAGHLHTTGLIEAIFKRPIPVLVHELEYYDAIAEQAVAANPPGLAADFIAWVQHQ